jgi:hypothetical protein
MTVVKRQINMDPDVEVGMIVLAPISRILWVNFLTASKCAMAPHS